MRNLTDYTLASDATLLQGVAKMNKNRSRTVVIVEGDKVTGLVSEGDIMRALLRGGDVHMPVLEVINRSFRYLNEVDDAQAFKLFQRYAFGLIPVVDEKFHLVDVITLEEILARVVLPERP